MCHSGCPPEHSNKSQLYASTPRFLNSIVTAWLSSHAINAFISQKLKGLRKSETKRTPTAKSKSTRQ